MATILDEIVTLHPDAEIPLGWSEAVLGFARRLHAVLQVCGDPPLWKEDGPLEAKRAQLYYHGEYAELYIAIRTAGYAPTLGKFMHLEPGPSLQG